MFSSPAVQIYLSENAEAVLQRKQVPHQLSRKPFIDRSVNGKSPADKKLKGKISTDKDINLKQKNSPKVAAPEILQNLDLDGEDYIFSDKEIKDTYNDVWPQLKLGRDGIIQFLRNYSYPKYTPPPSPEPDLDNFEPELGFIDSDFLELPKLLCTLKEPAPFDDSFEVDLPELQTFEDLDSSI